MPLNEREAAILQSYEAELADVKSPRFIRVPLELGLPSEVGDLEIALYDAQNREIITDEQFDSALGFCGALRKRSDGDAIIAELTYESDPDGSVWVLLEEDEDRDA